MKIAVIGAGIIGVTTAYELAVDGHEVTVFEAGQHFGGHANTVDVTIDGFEVSVPKGTLVIRAAEMLGIQIPRFCDHPLLDPVGACRQCIVEVEGQRKPMASCTITCTEPPTNTASKAARTAIGPTARGPPGCTQAISSSSARSPQQPQGSPINCKYSAYPALAQAKPPLNSILMQASGGLPTRRPA